MRQPERLPDEASQAAFRGSRICRLTSWIGSQPPLLSAVCRFAAVLCLKAEAPSFLQDKVEHSDAGFSPSTKESGTVNLKTKLPPSVPSMHNFLTTRHPFVRRGFQRHLQIQWSDRKIVLHSIAAPLFCPGDH